MDSIIFDVDGTLWDSTAVVARSWNIALKEQAGVDFEITEEELVSHFGKTMTDIADSLFSFLPQEERMRVLEICMDYEVLYLEDHPGIPYPGVLDTIPLLAEKYPLYIVSNCQCGYIEVLLKTLGLTPYVKDHLCFGETGTSKGQTIRTLMKKNGLESPIYVGDTQGDADACKEADIPFLFAEYGFGSVPDAAQSIRQFSDLKTLLS